LLLELSGWLSLIGILSCSSIYIWNMVNPAQGERRVKIHSYIGLASLITILIHIVSLPSIDFSNWLPWTAVGFYFIIISTGVTLLYLPDAGGLRYHARSFHPAILVGLLILILYHLI